MNVSPDMIIQQMKNGLNPQQLVMSYLQNQLGNNPMAQNLFTLAQQGRGNEIEAIARNMCASKGVNFDKEFNAFRQKIGR